MQLGRYTKIAVRAAGVLVALMLGMAALSILEYRRTQGELGAVLSAFLFDRLLRDIHDSGSDVPSRHVILSRGGPQDAYWRVRWLNLALDRQRLFPQASLVTHSSFFLSNAITTDTHAELHPPKGLDFVVVSDEELQRGEAGDFERRFPNNFVFYGVSQIGLNFSKTEAIFYIDYYCGVLCAGGEYILMRKLNGVWSVVDHRMTWVS